MDFEPCPFQITNAGLVTVSILAEVTYDDMRHRVSTLVRLSNDARLLTQYTDTPHNQIACEFCSRKFSRKYGDLEEFKTTGTDSLD